MMDLARDAAAVSSCSVAEAREAIERATRVEVDPLTELVYAGVAARGSYYDEDDEVEAALLAEEAANRAARQIARSLAALDPVRLVGRVVGQTYECSLCGASSTASIRHAIVVDHRRHCVWLHATRWVDEHDDGEPEPGDPWGIATVEPSERYL